MGITSPERTRQIEELVKSALERPRGERSAFLDEACAGDAGIRAEVDAFLQFQDEASQFIEQGALHVAAETLLRGSGLSFPQQIEGYEIISRIGVGGMGEVYLAQDAKLRRKVALKLVRAGLDSAELVSRFRHEERILASLNHPNIAQLYGAGVANGDIPYFAMEYVEGQRIDEYCEANSLSARARLELFRKVCGAVHYAHQRLIIHRDLKPSNILVTAAGEPKLLDFGIAKLMEGHDALTQTQTLVTGVMTPDYASPEQVRGEAMTTSTDVYSLGVLLYELLTGQRPYRLKTRSPDEIARAITDQEPERPSTAVTKIDHPPSSSLDSRSLRGDIDNIVLMALRKEPQRRYASVEQFSEDIRRHLEGRPVIAHKDTIAYRATKFVKRQKLAVAAALLIVSTLIAAVVLTTRQQRRAERRFNDVRQLSNALLTEIAPKIERLQGATEARQSVLTQSLKYLDSLAKESAGDPALQSELAAAYEKVGDLQGNPTNPNLIALGDALKSYEKAQEIRQQLIAHEPRNPEQRRLLANNYRVLGDLRWQTNEPAESRKNSEAALRIYAELLAQNPGSTELRLGWIQTNHDIGHGLSTNEKYTESIGYFQQAIAAAEELRQQSPNRVDVLKALGNCRRQLGNSLAWEGKQKEAEAEMEVALAIYEPLAAANPTDVSIRAGLYQTYMQTSSLYEEVNDALATEYGLKALRIISENVEKDPANLRAKQQLAKTYSRLGVTLDNEGKSAESILHLEKAVVLLHEMVRNETKNRRFTQDLATAFIRLGDSRRKQRNFSAAVLDLEKAATILMELAASDPNDNASLRNLANASGSLAKAHEELAKTANADDALSHRRSAREQLRRAVDSLQQLEKRNALSKYDRKSLEELQVALQKSENDQ
jgi:eukaryotic-like serine/threonine-protein kinase